jgi:hypothetical protein
MRRLRGLRAGLPGRGDLLRRRRAEFTAENARFFDQLGSPGGAAKTGPLPCDTAYVASYLTDR